MNTPGIDPDPVPPDKGGNILATQVIANAFKMVLEEEISGSFMDKTSQDLNSVSPFHINSSNSTVNISTLRKDENRATGVNTTTEPSVMVTKK
ncbi:hypothetical protein WA026_017476 [Henosepilachna vigintioctopunctata]|uniref:Uncharacterized protein n=1 Tax=Henosepilachna vigintioctopunctata TaxID=420089 RepID=A0AAW1VFE9_9CUCU